MTVIHRGIPRSKWAKAYHRAEDDARKERRAIRAMKAGQVIKPKMRKEFWADAMELVEIRRALGLSLDQMARLLENDITSADVSLMEQCRRKIPRAVSRRLLSKKLKKAAAKLLAWGPNTRLTKEAERVAERRRTFKLHQRTLVH